MYIKVRVTADSKKEKIEKIKEDHFNIWVKEEAKQNMANKRVLELIAATLGINKNKLKIISGHHSPSKILSISE